MNNKIRILLLTLILLSPLSAQWIQTNGPYGGYVVCLSEYNGKLYAGTTGGVFVSSDKGVNWESFGLKDFTVTAFAGYNGDLLAGSDMYGVLVYPAKAGSWSMNLLTDYVSQIMRYGDEVLIGTDAGFIVATYDGALLKPLNRGLSNIPVKSISVIDNRILAGTVNGLYISTDNGKNWNQIGDTLKNKQISTLLVFNGNIIAGTYHGAYLSTDLGATWKSVNVGDKNINCSLLEDGNIYLGTNKGVFASIDYGQTWVETNSGIEGLEVYSMAASGGNIVAATYIGTFYSTDKGMSWVKPKTGVISYSVNSMLLDSGSLYACTNGNGIFLSTNYGESWTEAGLQKKAIVKLLVDQGDMYATTGTEGIYYSSNKGVEWTPINKGLLNNYVSAFTIKDKVLYAATAYSGFYYSIDKGKNWITVNGGITSSIFDFATADSLIFACVYAGVYVSSNNGLKWTAVNNGLPNTSFFCLLAKDSCVFAGTAKGVYRTTDKGNNWISANNGITSNYINRLYNHNGNLFAATTSGIFVSSNNGNEWRKAGPDNFNLRIFSLLVNGDYLFAGAFNTGIWRYPLSGIFTDVKTTDLTKPDNYLLMQNYPNPFNPSTTIQYELKGADYVTLKIYDMLGREVETIVKGYQNAGLHKVEFNAPNLSAGIYVYQLNAGGKFMESKKMMLLK